MIWNGEKMKKRKKDVEEDWEVCPACQTNLFVIYDGKRYSRLIGIEDPLLYDGVSFWQCPDCGLRWNRWTKKEVIYENENYVLYYQPKK